jgi:hypothetical protein
MMYQLACTNARMASLPETFPSRPMHYTATITGGLPFPTAQRDKGRLILRPQPCNNRFFDINDRFLFVLSLKNASREGLSFSDDPAVFSVSKCNVKDDTKRPKQVHETNSSRDRTALRSCSGIIKLWK